MGESEVIPQPLLMLLVDQVADTGGAQLLQGMFLERQVLWRRTISDNVTQLLIES